ncbi:unnamed protein product [Cyclocybe aegerita]|uniref:Amidase domain-containing protein n=1 Tax=Cyclocybe aegerita TaxID=1973307 RepID=A0A8S0WJ63_CYCAE|nr:unnamed protein product [Cyclocybe aegerita]
MMRICRGIPAGIAAFSLLGLLPTYVVGVPLVPLSFLGFGTIFNFPTSTSPDVLHLSGSQPSHTISYVSPSLSLSTDLHPATNVWVQDASITRESLEPQLLTYAKVDDVWSKDFLSTLVISYRGGSPARIEVSAYLWLKTLGVRQVLLEGPIQRPPNEKIPSSQIVLREVIPPGPLVLQQRRDGKEGITVHAVYRLYPDEYEAFAFGTIPNVVQGGWILTNITTPAQPASEREEEEGPTPQLIPVPSRLTMISTRNLPLAGTRFGLKDIFDVENLPTFAGSTAFSLVNPLPTSTAPSVQVLLSLGASLVGKTRTSQFAHGAQPWEFRDVGYSYNPRGDGYLSASASSSGSACAVAGYEWLEFGVGSDTRGSVRKPAALVGVYGIRPTHGALPLDGVLPLSEEMDTAGFFARHPMIFDQVARSWYADSLVVSRRPTSRFPKKLLYPTDHFHMKSLAAQKLVDEFVRSLQTHLKMKPVHTNFTEILTPFFPNGSFAAFQLSSNTLAEYRSWQSVGKPTILAFEDRFGEKPVFDPVPQRVFARAQSISEQDFNEAVEVKKSFRTALATHVFKDDRASCSDALFMYDAGTGGHPSYRVEEFNHLAGSVPVLLTSPPPGHPHPPKSSEYFHYVASMADLPEVAIPLGEAPYFSQVSRRWESIPVAVQLVARRGCDVVLLDLVKRLAEKGVVGPVEVGRSLEMP